jgi:Geranylgeranyl pyrophosphate synthase
MTDTHPMNFAETVMTGVRAAVAGALSCEAAPVQLALRLLLSNQQMPIRAFVTSSLHSGQTGIDAGTALDLIHLSLQRLHAGVDAPGGVSALLGDAAAVLAGDYLTTGAFRLLVRCANPHVLAVVSDAVTRAAELEAANLSRAQDTSGDPVLWLRTRQRLAAPLGEAAGTVGAILAGYPDPLADVARRYGASLVASQVLMQEADVMDRCGARTALHGGALDLCRQATQHAQTIATATGNQRPLELVDLNMANIEAVRSAP